jgi:negative regulator of sigma-B (phosphoserine phosphatase)
MLVGVLDGLGHGPLAATATRAAQAVLQSQADASGDDLASLVRSCQRQLTGTRGVVMTLVFFSNTSSTMTWLGVGNVEGVVLRADPRNGSTRVVLRGGVVGGSLPTLHSSTVALTAGDLVILATDGVESRFAANIDRSREPAQIADEILATFAKNSDDALVLVARWGDSS